MKTLTLEIAMLLRGRRAVAAALVFAFVMILSGASSLTSQFRADHEKSAVARAERMRWLNQGDKDAHEAAHYSIYAFRQSIPIQALEPGIQPYVGQAVWLEPHWQNDMVYRPLQDAEPFQRMGIADPARFVIEFGPLLVFLVAFAATAADRGAARRPSIYVWGKWAAVSLFSIAALLLPALIVGTVATISNFSLDNAARLVSWMAVYAVYLGILAAIGVAVCLNARSARLGFAALLGLWAVLAFVAPRAASSAASNLTPLPSYTAVKAEMQREAPVYWSAETGQAQTKAIMKRYNVTRLEDLPVDLRGALLDFNERRSHGIFDRILGGFYTRVTDQDKSFAGLSWMSPAIATQSLSTALAGSNFAQQQDFITASESYRRSLVNGMNAILMRSKIKVSAAYQLNGKTAADGDYKKVPEFKYSPPPVTMALSSAGLAPLYLAIWLIIGLALLVWTTRRVHP